jgi:pyruvate formate lyase activating enzyme
VELCPVHAHSIVDGRKVFDRGLCRTHGICTENCFTNALVIAGEEMSVEQVMEEVLKDRAFYLNSGGGVTLSGGEPLVQFDFTRAILQSCREVGVTTAIETSGHAPWNRIRSLLPLLDLVMMDLKHMDREKHRRTTGASNELILGNARRLAEMQVPIIFRLPVIPGVNDTPKAVEAVARFVGELKEKRAEIKGTPEALKEITLELLAFHPLAGDKYRSLGMENPAQGLKPLPDAEMENFRNIVKSIFSETSNT